MFKIDTLSAAASAHADMVRAAAEIESVVQPNDAWSVAVIEDMMAQDSVWLSVATGSDDEVVGYCLYQVIFDQAEILRIGTSQIHQRQGIASLLFAALHDTLQVKNVSSLLLEVRADNHAAIALYEQQAFRIIHKRKGYYQSAHRPAVDALIMQHEYTGNSAKI